MSEPKDDDVFVVICWPKELLTNPVTGATVDHCQKCGIEIWVAPSTKRAPFPIPPRLLCVTCAWIEIKASTEPVEWGGPMPGTAEELMDHIKRSRAKYN